ncbi:MAG: LPS export ABC transporter periplasmic protein LptC [Gammaproteobacteria bacterium]
MNLRTLWGSLLLVTVTGMSFWLLGQVETRPVHPANPITTPRYFLTQATLDHWNRPGRPLYRVEALRLERLGHPGFFVLSKPDFESRATDATVWKVRSRKGILYSQNHILKLWNAVSARGTRPFMRFPLTVNTPRLTIALATDRATTSARTTLRYGLNRMTGVGFTLDLKTNRLALLSRVHGRIVLRQPGGTR